MFKEAFLDAHPRQAQDEPHGKVLFTFLGGLACDLEGVGAVARQFSNLNHLYIEIAFI
jgi:hypothetical protein